MTNGIVGPRFYPISRIVARGVRANGGGITPYAAPVSPAPAPGTIAPGELLVDAQYRTIWLGVDAAVDPVQALLISDMAMLIQADADNLAAAKAYTDQQIATRAPLHHTHPVSDITGFDQAVKDLIGQQTPVKKQMIVMFSGAQAWIGNNTGPVDLTGWALCDGNNGTPNMKDRFVMQVGNKDVGAFNTINPNALKQTGSAGRHAHGNATLGTALAAGHLPPHVHPYVEDLIGTGGQPNGHHHVVVDFGTPTNVTYMTGATYGGTTATKTFWIKSTADLVTRASPVYITIGINSTGNAPHYHSIAEQADHSHSLPADAFEALPYLVLAFIMKL